MGGAGSRSVKVIHNLSFVLWDSDICHQIIESDRDRARTLQESSVKVYC